MARPVLVKMATITSPVFNRLENKSLNMFTERGKYVQVSIPGPCLQCLYHTEFG